MGRLAARRAVLAWAVALLACEAPPAPPPHPAPPADSDREPMFSVEDGPMTLSMRRVRAEGWRGRLITVSFAPGERHVRVVPSESPRALDGIVAGLGEPRGVDGGESLVRADRAARRAARSAVAIDARGVLHFVIAFDERAVAEEEGARIVLDEDSGTTGPTLGELASLLAEAPAEGGLGAVTALALDGGFSTSLTVKSALRALRVVAYRATINAIVASTSAPSAD